MSSLTCVALIALKIFVVSVISTKRLFLWCLEIFGGISNEISVLLNESTLPRDMKGIVFGCELQLYGFQKKKFAAKSYLAKREEDPAAIVCLGDSAYHQSSVKGNWGSVYWYHSEMMVSSKR